MQPPCANWGNANPFKHHCNATLADARWVKAQAAARKAAGPQWGQAPQAAAQVSIPDAGPVCAEQQQLQKRAENGQCRPAHNCLQLMQQEQLGSADQHAHA